VLGLVRSAALDAGEWDEGNGLAAAPHLLHALVARHGEACVSPPGAQSPPLVYVAGERVTGDEDGLGR
jgi:hypothetical protein